MTLKEYQKECLKIEPKYLTRGDEALLGLIGLNYSAGEAVGIYKKSLYDGAELDQEGLLTALGRAMCYISVSANGLDVDLATIMKKSLEFTTDAGDK